MDELELLEYKRVMTDLSKKFEEALKTSLSKPYPFAPGFNNKRTPFGVRNMKVKTGSLFKSIKVNFNQEKDEVVVNMLDYWRFVNDGRRPGKYVPIKDLIKWVRDKGFNRDEKGRFKSFNIKSMAFAVSKNIYKFGIQPTYFYDNTLETFENAFEDQAVIALGIDIENFFDKVIEENIVKTLK